MTRGFTLLELLAVMLIAALAASLVLPAFSGLSTAVGLRTTARELASTLRAARGEALAQQRETAVQLDVERRAWQVAGTEKRHQLPSGIELGLVAAHTELQDERQAGIRFFADGSSSGGQVIVSAAGRRFLVDVDWLTGRVSIHD